MAAVTVFISCLIILSTPFSLIDRERRLAHWLGTVWGNTLMRLNPFWRVKTTGLEKIRNGRSYVLVANHASLSDIVCLFSLNHQFKWLAKKSLFKIPFLGWSMGAMGYIPLERGQYGSIRTSYRQALDWLGRGISILIFPEGTRSRTGEMGKFKSGAFRLAIESGRPIVPIVLAGTQSVISKGKAAFGNPGTASINVLSPIETKGMKLEEGENLRKRVETLMSEELFRRNKVIIRTGRGDSR